MKKRAVIFVLTGLLLLSGCTKTRETNENTISVDKNGTVTGVIVESFDKDYYDEGELKSQIESALAESGNAELEDYAVTAGNVKVTIEYGSGNDYASFNNVDFFHGTVQEALNLGYAFEDTFSKIEKGSVAGSAEPDEVRGQTDYKVMILQEYTKVVVPGNICYISDGVEILDKKEAKVTAAVSAAPQTEEVQTESAQSESGTEEAAETTAENQSEDTAEDNSMFTSKLMYVVYK